MKTPSYSRSDAISDPLIKIQHLTKVFPPQVLALNDVSVDFREGEIHAIVGENGAGKSTLMKILYGLYPADEGEIHYRGRSVHYVTPRDAIDDGIGMVHQEILLIHEYTVWENVVLGREPVGRFGRIDREKAREAVQHKIDEFGFNLDVDAKIADLSVAARQKVEILKLLYRDVSFLILDEPTAVLTPQEIPQLFDELRRLRDNGHTIAFISHHLDEVLSLSDRITVLRKGRKIATIATETVTERTLAEMMVGREVLFDPITDHVAPGEPVFEMRDVSLTSPTGKTLLNSVSITVRSSEIVGIAGVEGNGQLPLVEVITGLATPERGSVRVNGADLSGLDILSRRKYMSFVSQDRSRLSGSLSASIADNVLMTHHRLNRTFTAAGGHLIDFRKAAQFARDVCSRFDVQLHSVGDAFRSLSGGNQQKVILGRELTLDTPFVLLDQPTRGLDVGSIEYVHHQIMEISRAQRAILILSADLDELFRITDRILVLYRGKIVADLKTSETDVREIGALMLEGAPNHA